MDKKLKRSRKAVSPVIAALLLIAISVAAAVVTYSWVMSMIRTQGAQAQTSIRVDEVLFFQPATSTDTVKVSVRNTGSVAATIKTIYLYKGTTQIAKADGIDYAIGAGDLREVGFTEAPTTWTAASMGAVPSKAVYGQTFSANLEVATGYSIKVVTDTGFTIEGTYYAPSSF